MVIRASEMIPIRLDYLFSDSGSLVDLRAARWGRIVANPAACHNIHTKSQAFYTLKKHDYMVGPSLYN